MTNSLGGVHNSLGGGTVIFHRWGYGIRRYTTVYDGIRRYTMVYDGMRWYAMVCDGMQPTDTMGCNGIQWHAMVYNRLWYFYNVTFLQRDIFATNLSSGKILLTLSCFFKFFVHDSFPGF